MDSDYPVANRTLSYLSGYQWVNLVQAKSNTYYRLQLGAWAILDVCGCHERPVRKYFESWIGMVCSSIAAEQADEELALSSLNNIFVSPHPGGEIAVRIS